MSACERSCDGLSWNNRTFYVTASVPYSCEAARGVARCEYITPEPIDIQAVWRSTDTEIAYDRDCEANIADRHGHCCFRVDRRTCRRDRHRAFVRLHNRHRYRRGWRKGVREQYAVASWQACRLLFRALPVAFLGTYGATESSTPRDRHRPLFRHRSRPRNRSPPAAGTPRRRDRHDDRRT